LFRLLRPFVSDPTRPRPSSADEAAAFASVERLVRKLVNQRLRRNEALGRHRDDILADAHIAAFDAIRKYDPARGVKLVTFVGSSVDMKLRTIVKAYFGTSGIRVPIYLMGGDSKGNTHPLREAAQKALERAPSLDTPLDDENAAESWLEDRRGREAHEEASAHEREGLLRGALRRLDPRSRQILVRRHGLFDAAPETLKSIGDSLGLSRERVRQIEVVALQALGRRLWWMEEDEA
jgi:RNA polymerase sigma factor (sigma-70 family)